MTNLGRSDQELLRLIDGALKTAASMDYHLVLDEKKLALVGATDQLIAMLRDRNLFRQEAVPAETALGH